MTAPTESTILAEIEAIEALAQRMRALDDNPCSLCRPDDPCWFCRSLHTQEHRHVPSNP